MSKVLVPNGFLKLSSMCYLGQSTTLNLMQCNSQEVPPITEELQQLLAEYADVFEVPKELSTHISLDHKIQLKASDVSVNVRPYRYPPAQKDTIESMIKELLESGVIRPINSPFSSPIVMVKKNDGS